MTDLGEARLDESLLARARDLADDGRALLGVCGAPGAGKSTLAVRLARGLGDTAVVVPMDGFHLHDDELRRLGLADRKGAPETFDVAGYTSLLRRLRHEPTTPSTLPRSTGPGSWRSPARSACGRGTGW